MATVRELPALTLVTAVLAVRWLAKAVAILCEQLYYALLLVLPRLNARFKCSSRWTRSFPGGCRLRTLLLMPVAALAPLPPLLDTLLLPAGPRRPRTTG